MCFNKCLQNFVEYVILITTSCLAFFLGQMFSTMLRGSDCTRPIYSTEWRGANSIKSFWDIFADIVLESWYCILCSRLRIRINDRVLYQKLQISYIEFSPALKENFVLLLFVFFKWLYFNKTFRSFLNTMLTGLSIPDEAELIRFEQSIQSDFKRSVDLRAWSSGKRFVTNCASVSAIWLAKKKTAIPACFGGRASLLWT